MQHEPGPPDMEKVICRDCMLNIDEKRCLRCMRIKLEAIFGGGAYKYRRTE